jgi:hypothetical protein
MQNRFIRAIGGVLAGLAVFVVGVQVAPTTVEAQQPFPQGPLLFLDFYGRPNAVPWTGLPVAQVKRITPPRQSVYAQIVSLREFRLNNKSVVTDGNGAAMRMRTIEVAHSNPPVAQGGERSRQVDFSRNGCGVSVAETFSIEETEQGVQLGGGSKIGPDGPVDSFFVTGFYRDNLPIYSDCLVTGLYSSDVTAGPEFRLVWVD